MSKKRIRELTSKIKKIFNSADKYIEERTVLQNEEDIKAKKKLLGKCFKYKNSMGSTKWIDYHKFTDITKYGMIVFTVSIKDKEVSVNIDECSGTGRYLQETPISESLFDKKCKEALELLKNE